MLYGEMYFRHIKYDSFFAKLYSYLHIRNSYFWKVQQKANKKINHYLEFPPYLFVIY